jgi:RNA polymerase sigma-70 factor, ECF subfamily
MSRRSTADGTPASPVGLPVRDDLLPKPSDPEAAAPSSEAEAPSEDESRDLPSEAAPDPDALLMLRVQAGDREAFRSLFDRHVGGVTRFATHFLGNAARGEEIAQDVFLQLYRARARYEPRARFSTYLYTIAQNLCRNEVRRPEYRSRIEPIDRGPEEPPMDWIDEAATARAGEAEASGRELAERLRSLLAELPEAQRTALILSRSRELRYQAIGEIMSCSEQAVKSLIFRATRRLKEGLKGYLEEE